ncbi:MAG: SMP-30/gluconolactonase/LRE family protein, partial [Candidatus Riflebacteria bacterium]
NSTLLTVLALNSISHARRPAGSTLTLKGHGFGTNTGFVLLDETALTNFSKWTDEEIGLILPTSMSGDFQLKVSVQGVRSTAISFSVAKVSGITPADGWPGREIVISGQKLGTGQNGDQVLFQNLPAPVISWQDTEIRVRVPADATTGSMTLIIGEWPVVLANDFEISRTYEYAQASPDWSGPRANSRPLLPGVAIDSNETVFTTDYDNGWVWKIAKDGSQQKFGNLSNPWGIAIAPDGRGIYVADSGNNCIRVFDTSGNLKRTIGSLGSGNLQFSGPRGLAFAQNNYLLVADAGNHRIQVLDNLDAYVTSFGSYGTGNGQFYSPSGISVDTNLIAYVADSRNHRIQRFNPNSTTNPGTWTFSGWLGSNDPNAASPGWLTTGSGLSSSKDGGFNQPYGIGITDDGKLLIGDTNNNRIQIFTAATGLFSGKIGTAGTTSGQLNQPLAVIFDGSNVVIADSSNARIQKTSIDGAFIGQNIPDTSKLITNPRRLAVDSKNRRFYVLDKDDSSITVFDLEGNPLQIIGSKGSGREQFYLPEGLCTDSDGNLYVADTGNARIHKLSVKGEFLQNWGIYGSGSGQFHQPSAVAVSNDGQYLYITDSSLNRVQKFSNQGSFVISWGKTGNDDEGFNNPSGIAIDRNNFLYIADQNNHRVKKYDGDGHLIGWWGAYDAGAQAFWLDPASNRTGALSDANGAFDTPTDVTVDLEGNVFVTDSNNFRIQRFASNQSELTDAGYQTEIYLGDNSSALTIDTWGTVYCLSSGKTVLRFLPDL